MQNGSRMSFTGTDSWTLLSPVEQSIKQKIETVGVPLRDWDVCIYRGILTGFNEAFIISGEKKDELISIDPKSAEIIRPILRGRDIKRYGFNFADLWLIVSHNGVKEQNIPRIRIEEYPAIKAHLDQYYEKLMRRADKGDTPYNLRNCVYMDDFSKPKLMWAETMRIQKDNKERFPRFSFCTQELFTDKTCFIATGKNLEVILAFLNSIVSRYQLSKTVAMMDNGGYLMQKIYLEQIRIPVFSAERQNALKRCAEGLLASPSVTKAEEFEDEIDDIVFDAFGLTMEEKRYIINTLHQPLSRGH